MTNFEAFDELNEAMDTVVVERHDDGVVELRLDRQRRMNAIDKEMLSDLTLVTGHINDDPPDGLVLTAGGRRAFSIGLDPNIFEDVHEIDRPTEYFSHTLDTPFMRFTNALERMDAPVVGAIQGGAYGGGLELAMATDVRIAGESTDAAMPEVGHGFPPAGGATQRLPALIGEARAKEMMFTRNRYDAETLADWGLFYRVVPDEEVEAEAFELAAKLAENPGKAYGAVKDATCIHNNRRLTGFDVERRAAEALIADAEYAEMD